MPAILEYYIRAYINCVDFRGRATRPEFWSFALVQFVILAVVWVLGLAIEPLNWLGTIYWLATLVPSVAVTVRRLHDTDRSGWWALMYLVPLIGWAVLLILLAGPTSASAGPAENTGSGPEAGDVPASVPSQILPPTPLQASTRGTTQGGNRTLASVISIALVLASVGVIGGTFLPWAESELLALGREFDRSIPPELNAFQLAAYLTEFSDVSDGVFIVVALPMLLALANLIVGLAGVGIGRWVPIMGVLTVLSSSVMFLVAVGIAVLGVALADERDVDLRASYGIYFVAMFSVLSIVLSIWGTIALSRRR